MLTEKSKILSKQTVPLLQDKGTEITSIFILRCLRLTQNY